MKNLDEMNESELRETLESVLRALADYGVAITFKDNTWRIDESVIFDFIKQQTLSEAIYNAITEISMAEYL